jgi:hypothetical protein
VNACELEEDAMNEQKEKIRKELEGFLPKLVKRVKTYKGKGISQADTRAKLIEPLFERLGWDLRGEEVIRAYAIKADWEPVHYLLKVGDESRLLVETRKLDKSLDTKDAARVLEYGVAAGVNWCVLTNGRDIKIYNSKWPESAGKKLFVETSLGSLYKDLEQGFSDFFETIWLLSRESVKSNELQDEGDREHTKRVILEIWKEEKTVAFVAERAKRKKIGERTVRQCVKELEIRDLFPFPAKSPQELATEEETAKESESERAVAEVLSEAGAASSLSPKKASSASKKTVLPPQEKSVLSTVEQAAEGVREAAVRKAFIAAAGKLKRLGRDVKEEPGKRSVVYKVRNKAFVKLNSHEDYFEIKMLNPSTGKWPSYSYEMRGKNLNRLKDRIDKAKEVYRSVRKK